MTNISDKNQLSPRQKTLLFAVVKEYCETGQNVGSKEIKDKYNFRFSAATIRNEFAKLRDLGFLFQPFTNSSSQPTEKAFKMFINQLLQGLQVTTQRQKELQIQLLMMQQKQSTLDKEISKLLAIQTKSVGFLVNEQDENVSGLKNLLETGSEGKVSDLLDFLENLDSYKQLLLEGGEKTENSKKHNKLQTFFGSDNPIIPLGQGFAMVSASITIKKQKSVVGLIAPTHLLAKKKNLELIEGISKLLGD
jgi:transcriptional regulator of heat shock response